MTMIQLNDILYFSSDQNQNGLIATTVIHVRDDITEWGQVRMPFVVQPALQCINSNCTRYINVRGFAMYKVKLYEAQCFATYKCTRRPAV